MAKSVSKLLNTELARLKSALNYDPKTGEFVWRVRRRSYAGCVVPGDVAGSPAKDRDGGIHINIGVDGKTYKAHRLAWFFMTGKRPIGDIDHKDGVRTHNRWSNLRPATRGQNNHNRAKITASNVSGKTGVSWVAGRNQWMSRIVVDHKIIHLGMFSRDKLSDAVVARRSAELKYYGEYATKEISARVLSNAELKALPNAKPSARVNPRNVSGKTGVAWMEREQKWRSLIQVDRTPVCLGMFVKDKLADAIKARKAGELKYLGKYLLT